MRLAILLLLSLGLAACGDSGDAAPENVQDAGTTSRPDGGTAPESTQRKKLPSGVEILDLVVGEGPIARAGDRVVAHATGWTKDGRKFWSSHDDGKSYTFHLANPGVIQGWVDGVPGMMVGGKRKIWIPWPLGYPDGNAGAGIPPRTDLVFEVELLGVE